MVDALTSFPQLIVCPHCGKEHVRRSHSKWYDRFLHLFSIYAFRCKACNCRFHRMLSKEARQRILHS